MINLEAVVSLDTGDKIEHIYIYEGDDVELLADYFCERHHIRSEGKQYIVKEIQNQLYSKPITKRRHISTLSMTSHKSQVMIQKLYRNKTEDDVHLYLYKEGKNQQQRKLSAIKERQEQSKQICTGRPHINNISREIVKHRAHSQEPIFKKLYKDAALLQKKKKEKGDRIFQEKHPFQVAKDSIVSTTKELQRKHVDRLYQENSKNQQKQQLKRFEKNQADYTDKTTGKELFKPIINKNTHLFRRVSRKVNEYDKKLKDYIDKGLISLNRLQSRSTSRNKQVENNILNVKKLFNQLDSDRDGLISIQFINLNIDAKTLQKINPILCYLEQKNEEINLDYFYDLLQLQHIKLL